MPLTPAELNRAAALKTRDQVLLLLAAQIRGQWWATAQELAGMTGIHLRRVQLQLAALTSSGVFERKWSGNGAQARFRLAATAIDSIVVTAIDSIVVPRSTRSWSGAAPTRRTQARDHAQQRSDPDPSLDPRSMDQRVRPSGGVQGGEPAADGRTEGSKEPRAELRNALLAWVQERHNVEPRLSTPGLMRLVNAGATEHELRAFLTDLERGTHPCFDGIEHAQFRFGAACTVERFAKWRASRARPPRRGPSVREQLEREPHGMPAPDEMSAIAELVRARLK